MLKKILTIGLDGDIILGESCVWRYVVMENNKKRKFYNLYLNNNVCGGKEEKGCHSNVFSCVYYDNCVDESENDYRDSAFDALIIAELVDGEMIDVITEDVIVLNKENVPNAHLSYSSSRLMSNEAVVAELQRHYFNSIKKYKLLMQQVKEESIKKYNEHLDSVEGLEKKKHGKHRIKDIASNGFDLLSSDFKKKIRK